jgi:hypothetical protein
MNSFFYPKLLSGTCTSSTSTFTAPCGGPKRARWTASPTRCSAPRAATPTLPRCARESFPSWHYQQSKFKNTVVLSNRSLFVTEGSPISWLQLISTLVSFPPFFVRLFQRCLPLSRTSASAPAPAAPTPPLLTGKTSSPACTPLPRRSSSSPTWRPKRSGRNW